LAAEIASSHHERWDGQGYPFRLAGNAIPLAGRIVAVADNFDALTTARPYKEAWSIERAVEHIVGRAGTQFDPQCAEAFQKALPSILAIRLRISMIHHFSFRRQVDQHGSCLQHESALMRYEPVTRYRHGNRPLEGA
jgi:hypothetical protein